MKLIKVFGYAFEGLAHCFKKENNFKIHVVSAAAVIAGGFVFAVSPVEWMLLLLCITMVLSIEMVNTAIERLCDMISKERLSTIKLIKDLSAGAVLLAAVTSCIIGAIIFIPKIIHLLK